PDEAAEAMRAQKDGPDEALVSRNTSEGPIKPAGDAPNTDTPKAAEKAAEKAPDAADDAVDQVLIRRARTSQHGRNVGEVLALDEKGNIVAARLDVPGEGWKKGGK